MAELYRIENETLTSMADKIRILSGTEGTMTTAQMDSSLGDANTEVNTQADLLAQAVAALEGKAAGGGSSGGAVEYEVITIPAGATSAIYTLPRVTAAYGSANTCGEDITAIITSNEGVEIAKGYVLSINNTLCYYINYIFLENYYASTSSSTINQTDFVMEFDSGMVAYSGGTITFDSYSTVFCPITLLLINDPNADAIST